MDQETETVDNRARRLHSILTRKQIAILAAVPAIFISAILFINSHKVHSDGPRAGSAECSDIVDRSPDTVDSESRDWVIGNGVASWGNSTTVLRCGVNETGPTVDLCISVDGVDWVLDEKHLNATGVSILTAYGRSPEVQITYSGPRENVGGVLVDIGDSVSRIKQERKCIGYGEGL
ncbi:DUF3515 family protein [Streptomyces sp. NPDC058864]